MYELWSKESLTDLVACVNHFGGPYEGNFLCCFCPSYYWNRERDIGLSGVIMPFVPCVSCYPVCLATVNPSADKHHSLFSVCILILLNLSPHTLFVLLPSYPRYLSWYPFKTNIICLFRVLAVAIYFWGQIFADWLLSSQFSFCGR